MAEFIQYGGTSGGTYARYFTGKLSVWEISYSVSSNTSVVGYRLELISGSSGRFSGYSASYSVTIDGSVVNSGSGTYASQSYNTAQTICEGQTTITHNQDGSKSLSCSAVLDFGSGTYSPGDFYPSGSMTLTTIPRASNVSATNTTIGSLSVIVINPAVNTFTHTVSWSCAGQSGTLATKTNQTTLAFTPPNSLYQAFGTYRTKQATITCITYNGNTQIGTKTTACDISVPDSSKPVIDTASVSDINLTTYALTGDDRRIVQNASTLKVEASGRCLNYSTFSKFREQDIHELTTSTTVDGGTTNVTGTISYANFNRNELRLILVDGRGLTSDYVRLSEEAGNFTLIPYIPITASINTNRQSPTSSVVQLDFTGNFYNGYFDELNQNFNSIIIYWRYREKNGSWITTGALDPEIIEVDGEGWRALTLNTDYKYGEGNTFFSGNSTTAQKINLNGSFDYTKNYDLEIYISDRINETVIPKEITKGIPCFDYGEKSNGDNYFNVNGDIYQNGKSPIINNNYSTTEKEIGTWIDGKTLYRKVITFTDTVTGNVLFTKAHNISNADMVMIEKAYMVTNTGICYPVPMVGYNNNLTDKTNCFIDKNNINIFSNGGWGNVWTKIFIIEYTKTTD